jgi:hypothetical protein
MPKAGKNALNVRGTIVAFWRTLGRQLTDPYRPELHYMRGPGPKWREKYGQATPQMDRINPPTPATAETDGVPMLV